MSPDAPTPDVQATTDVKLLAGRYQLLDKLGEGGMGAVFRARDTKLDRLVALKMLPEGSAPDADAVSRFRREAKALARLSHPGIIQTHDSGEDGGKHFLVMELVEGHSLAAVLHEQGRVSPARAADFAYQAALALHHAHKSGLVHRDVKPSNLLLSADGRVRLLDLGLARFLQDQIGEAALTRTGTGMGTPDYCPPEQFRDARRADARSDVYSLGCTLYHLIGGRVPFPGSSLSEKVQAHEAHEATPLEELCPDVPAGLALAVQGMVAKRPADRFRSTAEVAEALTPYVAGSSAAFPQIRNSATWDGSRLATWPVMSRRRALVPWLVAGIAAALLLIAVGVVGVWTGWFRPGAPPVSQNTDPSPPDAVAPQANGEPKGESARPAGDPNVLTVAQKSGAARYQTIGAALDAVKPGQTIRVLDNAVYKESLRIWNRTEMAGITLEATGGATLALESAGGQSRLLDIANVPDVTVRGFRLRATRTPHAVLVVIRGAGPGLRLERLELTADGSPLTNGIEVYGSAGSAPERAPAVISDCAFRGFWVGTLFGAGPGNFFRTAVRDSLFADCDFGVQVMGGAAQDIQVVGNRFRSMGQAALQFLLLSEGAEDLLIANNTIIESAAAFRVWDTAIHGKRVQFSNNLILGSDGMDMLVVDAVNAQESRGPGDGAAAARTYRISHNWREGKEWGAGKGWIPPDPTKGDVHKNKIDGVNRDPKSPEFLRPAKDSPLAIAGAGDEDPSLPRYVGALSPQGAEPWDWDRAGRMPKDAQLLTVSKEPSARGKYRTVIDALKDARPWATIRVLDDATYEEEVKVIDRASLTGLTLEAIRQATLARPRSAKVAVVVDDVPDVVVRGFRLRSGKGPPDQSGSLLHTAALLANRRCAGFRLQALDFEAPLDSETGLAVFEDLRIGRAEQRVRVEHCRFRGGSVGLNVTSLSAPCESIDVCDNLFRESVYGVRLSGPTRGFRLLGNRMIGLRMFGLSMEAPRGLGQLVIANNTFLDCNHVLRVAALAPPPDVTFCNNLTLGPTPMDVGFLHFDGKPGAGPAPGDGAALLKAWEVSHNWRESPLPNQGEPEAATWVPPAPTDVRQDRITGIDRDPKSPGFLRPAPTSDLATKGAGNDDPRLPRYVGALPPQGAEPRDWERTWRVPRKELGDKK